MRRLAYIVMTALTLASGPVAVPAAVAAPAANTISTEPSDYLIGAWALYRSRFVTPEGRVVDDDNGSISHSESQGYGMVLAVAADDREGFDLIWRWTDQELFIRPDGLAAWKWDPAATPRVGDTNNATDGDMLIAWALLRAAERWHLPDLRLRARTITDAMVEHAIAEHKGRRILMPAVSGFGAGDQPDGPVVNLSYWVFPAIAELATISPALAAADLERSGLHLAREARFGRSELPTDWIALAGGEPAPARSFPPTFSYNAIRVPLYLAWRGNEDPRLLQPYLDRWTGEGPGVPDTVDVVNDLTVDRLSAPGYLAISDLVACALHGTPARERTRNFAPTTYYPSTLHLLSLMALAERYPRCL